MKAPSPEQWVRIHDLISRCGEEPLARVVMRLREMNSGEAEDPLVLSYVQLHFRLPPAPVPLAPGCVVAGRYVLREILGEGGMGVVFRALQQRTGRDVALKMIHPALASAGMAARFAREIETLGQLEHPSIVRVFDADVHRVAGSETEVPFFAMEMVSGEPLHGRLRPGAAPEGEVLELLRQVCLAVQYAHDRNIVHRDLKPANILMRSDGSPVVLDFGLAEARERMLVGSEEEGAAEMMAPLLGSGTPFYMAPERFLAGPRSFDLGRHGDLYALGVMLFELLTGRHPHDLSPRAPMAAVRAALLDRPPMRLREAMKDAASDLDEILARALQSRPEERYSSAGAFARALDRAAAARKKDTLPVPKWQPTIDAVVPATHWRLVRPLGEGGVGDVWLAEHEELRRRRVIKFCRDDAQARSLRRELTLFRLLRERLGDHPHFVRLHEASLDEEPRYLLMDHVEGQDLSAWAEGQGGPARVPRALWLELIAQAADALQAAHDAGVLHRDVKPGNLLVAPHPDEPSRWRIYLADFGIGQLAMPGIWEAASPGFTRTLIGPEAAEYSGSLLYMAPEFLARRPATVRSDLFSLGMVLFQALAGDFDLPLVADWECRICDPLLRNDLRGCLAGNPTERFGSLEEFSRRLRGYEGRRQEAARREAEMHARERAAYRRGVFRMAALAAMIVAVVASLALLAWEKSQAERAAARRAALARAHAAIGEAHALLAANTAGRTAQALKSLRAAVPGAPELAGDLRSLATRLLTETDHLPVWHRELPEMDPQVPISAAESSVAAARRDGAVFLLPLRDDSGAAAPTVFPAANEIGAPRRLALDPAGRRLAVVGSTGRCGWWEVGGARAFHLLPDEACAVAAFDAAGERLAIGRKAGEDGIAEIVVRRCADGAEQGRLVSRAFPFSREANALAFSPDGALLAASSEASHHALVWDVARAALHCQAYHRAEVSGVAWLLHPLEGLRLLAACRDAQTYVWPVATRRANGFLEAPVAHWPGRQWPVEQVLAHGARFAVTRDAAGEAVLWDAEENAPQVRFPAVSALRSIAVAGSGRMLRQTVGALELWAPRAISARVQIALPAAKRLEFDFSPEGGVVAVATGSELQFYGAGSGRELAAVAAAGARSVRFAADGSVLATYRYGPRRWQRREQPGAWHFGMPTPVVSEALSGTLEISANGEMALFAAGERAFLLDLARSQTVREYNINGIASELALTADGSGFAIAREDGTTLAGSRGAPEVEPVEGAGPWLVWRDGRWHGAARPSVVSGHFEAVAESENVWTLRTHGAELLRSPGEELRPLERLRFSRDGTRLGVLWRDGTLDIWRLPELRAELGPLGLDWSPPAGATKPGSEPTAIRVTAPEVFPPRTR